MRSVLLASTLFLLCPVVVCAGEKHPRVSDEYLATVTRNGRALFDYDQVAWHGTDALLATKPPIVEGSKYIASKTDAGWVVDFGLLNDAGDKYLVAYEAKSMVPSGTFDVKKFDPPVEGTGYFLAAAKAIYLALNDFAEATSTYNTAVLPAPGGNLYIYLYPGQTTDGVYPLGADVRYTVSSDGSKILEKRRLHKTILEMDTRTQSMVAGYHTHVLTDTPEDTDVLYVLTRQAHIPEYIGTSSGIYVVQTDGSIRFQKK